MTIRNDGMDTTKNNFILVAISRLSFYDEKDILMMSSL